MPVKKKTAAKKKAIRKASPEKKAVKRLKKKPVKSAVKARKKASPKKKEANVIGVVTHYFPKVNAAVIKLSAALNSGEMIRIKGHTTDFTQNIDSMQIDHVPISAAKKGDEIGLLVKSRVRQGDTASRP